MIFTSFLFCFIISSIAIADDDSKWSYDHYEAAQRPDGFASTRKNINPWSGERSGPKALNKEEQFNYGDESRLDPPPSIDDLYPQPGQEKSIRPWGRVPKSFQETDSNPYYEGYNGQKRVESDRYLPKSQEWPDSNGINRESYDSGRRGGQYIPQNRYIERGYSPRLQPYGEPPLRYGDSYRSPYGPLSNDAELGYDSWQRSNPWGRDRGLYRNNNLIPRY
ncbi:MAG: hypothetical protein HQL68_01205 [Magnetococcales bacterium]|nr:hypothetical protein [Magnetococcales bacterium]